MEAKQRLLGVMHDLVDNKNTVIVTEHKRLRHSDGTLTIFSPPSSVRRLFEITGLTTILDIVPATEER